MMMSGICLDTTEPFVTLFHVPKVINSTVVEGCSGKKKQLLYLYFSHKAPTCISGWCEK